MSRQDASEPPVVDRWAGLADGHPLPGPGGVAVPEGLVVQPHELATAWRLAAWGAHVRFRAIDNAPGVRNPDADMDGQAWEFKAPAGSSERNTIADQFKRAGRQSANAVIDLQRCGLPDDVAAQQCARRFASQDRIRHLVVLGKDGSILFHGALE